MAEESGVEDVTKEELAALLPSERAALVDDEEGDGAEQEAKAEEGQEQSDEEEESKSEDNEGADAEPAQSDESEEAAAPEAAAEADADDDDDDMPAFRFVPDEQYKAARDELIKQFEDPEGTMTLAEMTDKQDQLRSDAESRQHNEWLWDRTCRQFFRDNPTFKKEASPILHGMLDQAVRSVASDPANADKSGKWMLKTAHQKVLEELKSVTGSDTIKPKGAAKPAAKADAKPRPKAPDASKLPKTLGNLPDAEPGDAGEADDWMAELDRLADKDPLGYEQALARLPKHKEKAYLESR